MLRIVGETSFITAFKSSLGTGRTGSDPLARDIPFLSPATASKPSYSFAFLHSYSRYLTGDDAAQNGTYRIGIYAVFPMYASTEIQRSVCT
jgi:hypothetical protein